MTERKESSRLNPADKRALAGIKLGIAEVAMARARQALDRGVSLERVHSELTIAAMRSEEAARLVQELREGR